MASIQYVSPPESKFQPIFSVGSSVQKHRFTELFSNQSGEYSYNGNKTVKINISSVNEVLKGTESYLKFKIKFNGPANSLALNPGGLQNIFHRVRLLTQNGTELENLDNYNMWYNIMSYCTMSKEYVNSKQWTEFDSYEDGVISYRSVEETVDLLDGSDNATYTTGSRTVALSGNASSKAFRVGLKVGDTIKMVTDEGNFVSKVESITTEASDDYKFVLEDDDVPGANVSAGDLKELYVINNNGEDELLAPRSEICTNRDYVEVCVKLNLQCLLKSQFFPLMLVKQGLQLELNLEDPNLVMYSRRTPNTYDITALFSYSIKDVAYVASLYTLDQKTIEDMYLKDYNSNEGLKMNIQGVHSSMKNVSGSNDQFSDLVNKRSCRAVYTVITSSNISTNINDTSKCNESLSTFLKDGLQNFYYKSQSLRFPDYEIDTSDKYNTEAYTHLMNALKKHMNIQHEPRFTIKEYSGLNRNSLIVDDNGTDSTIEDSTKFIIGMRLDRHSSSYSGIDLSVNPLDTVFRFSGSIDSKLGTREIRNFIVYDRTIKISKNGIQYVD